MYMPEMTGIVTIGQKSLGLLKVIGITGTSIAHLAAALEQDHDRQ